MSVYLLGPLIKQKREELGITQEDLADGICSVPTLSRIENGERLPNAHHSEMLLQRLGYSDTLQINCVAKNGLELHDLKYKIRQAIIQNKREAAASLLDRFDSLADHDDCMMEQFILLYRTILSDALELPLRLERFLSAIHLTCPRFNPQKLPSFLSYEEIIAINNIALCKDECGEIDEAIELLYALTRHYNRRMVNAEEILRTQLMVLYNLSRFLVNAGRYDECIEICDAGIRISQETKRCSHLDRLFFNKARALVERNQPEDFQAAEASVRLAVGIAAGLGNDFYKQHYLLFLREFFERDHLSTDDPSQSEENARIS